MKLRIPSKLVLLKALNWYQEQLTMIYGPRATTPAHQELVRTKLIDLQNHQQRREPNSIWRVDVGVEFYDDGDYRVIPTNLKKQVLFIND